ncbi:death-associated protein kinase dapk-1-like [Patiria miniata]|uniref:Non-specific serine/threonine protein kinase n=1 Tax=Patiria miniata TaxID=46514 RepID=A0A913ZAB6_PATMI|nr:death-associated protein kinase dapk-1-like [Patiria miniata]
MGSTTTEAMLSAAMSGDTQTVTRCIDEGVNVNAKDIPLLFARTPLHYAAGSGYDVICDLLLQAGADVNAVDKNGRSPLHYATKSGHIYICKALIRTPRTSLELNDQFGDTPLLTAASWGNTLICEALIGVGANVSSKNKRGRTALHEASEAGHVDTCKALISAGASPFDIDQGCNTPLHLAAGSGGSRLCTMFMDKGADMSARNKDGNTPLHTACMKGHVQICQILLDGGADVTARNQAGDTVLHITAAYGRLECCRVILRNTGDICAKNKIGNTPLHVAASTANADICNLFIAENADALLRNNDGKTPKGLLPRTSGNAGKIITQTEKKQRFDKLVQMGTEPVNIVKLFLVGDPKAGKTTLQKALIKRRQWWLPGDWQTLATDYCDYHATPGIELCKQYVPGAGNFAFWDCAGQLEYHVTHAMFLGAQNCIYLLVYDVTKSNHLEGLRRWLAFVKAGHDYAYQTKPDVVIVATHLDQMTSKTDGKTLAASILQHVRADFNNHLDILNDVIAINSIKFASKAMARLRHTLECLASRIKGSRMMPRLCEEIRRLKHTWYQAKYPVISWNEFCSKVKAINRLADDSLIRTAAVFLADMSEIYFKKQCGDMDWVVLEPRWLSRVIIGRVFAGEDFPSPTNRLENKQIYSVSDIRQLLRNVADVYNVLDLLQHLELVYQYDDTHYIIPARLPTNLNPVVWSKDTRFTEYYGRRVQCKDITDIFSPDVFPCLQVRIMRWFCDGHGRVAISRQSLKFSGKIEGMVQLTSDQKAIHICVRGRSSREDRGACYSQLEHVLGMVLSELVQRSPGTATDICYLSPRSLMQHEDVGDISYYTETDIELSAKEGVVVHPQTSNTELTTDILCAGYDSRFLQRNGLECKCTWLLEEDVRALCRCLDVIHPLGQDYRSLAEALGVSEDELDYIYQICLHRDSSPTRALLDRSQPTVGRLRAICKHPGLVGNIDAVHVIDALLDRFGHRVNDEESKIKAEESFKPDNISVEVLVWREDLRQQASNLRLVLDPVSLLARFTHLFGVSDQEEIEATQRTLGRTKAVDNMLYKVIKSQRVELYHEFYGALEMHHNTGKVVDASTEVIPDSEGSYKDYIIAPAKPSQVQLDPHNNYCMWKGSKGLAYVLNNNDFHGKGRQGSGVDLGNMCHVLQELGYVLQVHTNLTAKDTSESLAKFVRRFDDAEYCSAVVVLMSHGNTGVITGVDEKCIQLRDIYSMFEGHRCPALLGKPKLFFIQACRGVTRTQLVEADSDVTQLEPEDHSDEEDPSIEMQADYSFARDLPANADMFFAYATTEGNLSLRSQVAGSWFIQALCEVFIKWASHDSLDVLMNKVTNRVTGQRGEIRDPLTRTLKSASQTPECIKCMRKNMYFLPKYPSSALAGATWM